jgi:hypothetical protein
VALALWLAPRPAPAMVNPVTLIERQIIKPNMLIVFDTSTSMIVAPGEFDVLDNEVGQDCDDGDNQCRMVGAIGRCFYAGIGAMGSGVSSDHTSCHNDAECRVGYCSNDTPQSCDQDADCGDSCQGFCSNNNNVACTSDANCGAGTCRGVCSDTLTTRCTCRSPTRRSTTKRGPSPPRS